MRLRLRSGCAAALGLVAAGSLLGGCGSGGTPTAPVVTATRYVVSVSTSAPAAGIVVTVQAQLATADGSPVATAGRAVVWSASGGSGNFASASTQTNAAGIATVGYTLSGAVATYRFTATDASALTGVSDPVTSVVGPPSASTSTLSAAAIAIPANGTSTTVITVQLRDAAGNALTTSGGTLTMTTTQGTLSAVTDSANGRYVATLRSSVGARTTTVSAAINAVALTATATVAFTVGAATKYIVTAPAAPVAGQGMPLRAQLTDANDAPVATAGRTVSWARIGTGGSFSAPTSATDATGAATVTFTSDLLVTTYTFTATDGALTGAASAVRTVAGAGVLYTVGTTVSPLTAGGAVLFTAQLRDVNGNAAPAIGLGRTVTWSTTGAGSTFSATTASVDSGGTARTTLTVGPTIGNTLTVTATDNAAITGTSASFTTVSGVVGSVRLTSARIVQLDSGATATATFQVVNQFGVVLSNPLNFAARGAAATVSSGGVVTAARVGQTLIVATESGGSGFADSILVAVTSPTGPVVRTDLSAFDLKKDTLRTITITSDMRSSGEKLGAATLQLLWDPTALTYVSDADGANSVGATVNATAAASGSLTITAASAAGLAGAVELRRITFRVANATKSGTLQLLATEFVGAGTFTNLLSRTLVISYPFFTR